MAHKQCVTRLQKEYKSLLKDPVPNIQAHPSPGNLLEWHFAIEGAKGTEYEGGVYHGKLVFPQEYPFKPPSISLVTPNGRFATNTKLCLSMTDFHPESWNPMWSVGTILTGLLSFMSDTQATTGSITTTKQDKERFARESLAVNVKNPTFRKLFPGWVEELARRQAAASQPALAPPAANGVEGRTGGTAGSQPQQTEEVVANGTQGEVGAAREAAGQQGHQHGHGQGPLNNNAIVTIAIVVVAIAAAVWVHYSGSGGYLMGAWTGGSAGRNTS